MSFSKDLASWVNPKKDSIKALKLHSITCFKIERHRKYVDYQIAYNTDGYILIDKLYSFKYDSNNNITQILFPDTKSKMDFTPDSMYIDNNTDTNKVFAALYLYNNIFYKKHRRYISKDGKGIDVPPDSYYDTLEICNGKIVKYSSKSKAYFDCKLTSLTMPDIVNDDLGYKGSYKYDFSQQPPSIEYTQADTLGKFKRTYYYGATRSFDSPIFSYILYDVITEIKGNEYNEYIEEYYTNGGRDKVSNFPIYVSHSKQFLDRVEIKRFEGKSSKKRKLIASYTLKTEYAYFD